MSNFVAQVAGIDRYQLFGVSFRHKATFFQGFYCVRPQGVQYGAGIVLEIYGHRCKILSPRLVFCHCAKVMSGIMPSRSRRRVSSFGMPITSATRLHLQLYTRYGAACGSPGKRISRPSTLKGLSTSTV